MMKNKFKILSWCFVLSLIYIKSAMAWDLVEIVVPQEQSLGSKKGRQVASFRFEPRNDRDDNIYELTAFDDNGLLTLACVGRILQLNVEKAYDSYLQATIGRKLSREEFYSNFINRSIATASIDADSQEAKLLRASFKLIDIALVSLNKKIVDCRDSIKPEKVAAMKKEFADLEVENFTYNHFFSLFGNWLNKNWNIACYYYNLKTTFSDDEGAYILPHPLKIEFLGVKTGLFKQLMENKIHPKNVSTLMVNFDQLQNSFHKILR